MACIESCFFKIEKSWNSIFWIFENLDFFKNCKIEKSALCKKVKIEKSVLHAKVRNWKTGFGAEHQNQIFDYLAGGQIFKKSGFGPNSLCLLVWRSRKGRISLFSKVKKWRKQKIWKLNFWRFWKFWFLKFFKKWKIEFLQFIKN